MKTHCNHGHELSGDNLIVRKVTTHQKQKMADGSIKTYTFNGVRTECRLCKRRYQKEYMAKYNKTDKAKSKQRTRYWRKRLNSLGIDRKA